MNTCTFFGHKECPACVKARLREVLKDLITNRSTELFYVGNQGQFDGMVRSVLRELMAEYPQIQYAVVLAYMPGKPTEYDEYSDTMLPEGIENIHPRYAISWRNNWMLQRSQYVVTYTTHTWGGAAHFKKKAIAQKKYVMELSEL